MANTKNSANVAAPMFEVTKVTASSKGGFIATLQNRTIITVASAFGDVMKTTQTTYYVKLASAPAVGLKAPLDMETFDVTERDYIVPPLNAQGLPNENAGEVLPLKWLSPKTA